MSNITMDGIYKQIKKDKNAAYYQKRKLENSIYCDVCQKKFDVYYYETHKSKSKHIRFSQAYNKILENRNK